MLLANCPVQLAGACPGNEARWRPATVVDAPTAPRLTDLAPRYRGDLGARCAQNGADEARIEIKREAWRKGDLETKHQRDSAPSTQNRCRCRRAAFSCCLREVSGPA
jgi:hypothetical protein